MNPVPQATTAGTHEPSGLPPAWVSWVAECLTSGIAAPAIAERLVADGVPAALARREVDAIAASPILRGARQAAGPALQAATLATERLARGPRRVEARPDLDADAFFTTYVAHGVPVLIPGFGASWPAMTGLGLDALAARVGDVEVAVCTGRSADPACDRRFREHVTRMSLAAWIELVRAGPPGNDRYMIANNRNLDGPLAAVLDQLTPPPGFVDPARLQGGASLWIGPAGTHTPTHHDTSNVLFTQWVGRKRVWLASPAEVRLAAAGEGFYAPYRLSDPAVTAPGGPLEGATVLQAEVGPGDALLLPVGWWHEVLALETSVSVSLTALRVRNRYDDHRPGFPAADGGKRHGAQGHS